MGTPCKNIMKDTVFLVHNLVIYFIHHKIIM